MTLLSELATAADFSAAVRELTDPICRRFDLPAAYQLGAVVCDVVAADRAMVRDWALGPAFIFDAPPGLWIENGKETRTSARFATDTRWS